jgi:hypothetical protein
MLVVEREYASDFKCMTESTNENTILYFIITVEEEDRQGSILYIILMYLQYISGKYENQNFYEEYQ